MTTFAIGELPTMGQEMKLCPPIHLDEDKIVKFVEDNKAKIFAIQAKFLVDVRRLARGEG